MSNDSYRRYDPIRRIHVIQRVPLGGEDASGPQGAFAPPTDVSESSDAYEIRLEIAGVDPDQVEIVVAGDGRAITISGLRAAGRFDPGSRYLNLEIQYGAFARRVRLPVEVDRQATSASYRDGFLVIRLPKVQRTSRRRRVPIVPDPSE